MSNQPFDLDALLGQILDDNKPLPGAPAEPPPPIRDPDEIATEVQVTTEMALADTVGPTLDIVDEPMLSPEDILSGIVNDDPPPVLTQRVNPPQPPDDLAEEESEAATQGVFGPTDTLPQTVFKDSADREEGAVIEPIKMPTFAAKDFAATVDIRNFATLVVLQTQRWHAKVKDRKAGKDAADANDADQGAFEVRKKLLAGADSMLKVIHKAIDEARAAHYEMTLPWTTTSMQDIGRRTGGRLLPNTLFVEYTTRMAEFKAKMLKALDEFVPQYPALIEAARKNLGKRFDAREYPNVSAIREHFGLSFDFQPIPKGDDYKGLPQQQLDALARKINDNTQAMAENAMQEVWKRLHEVVSRMAERLSSPDKVFHDSLVQNVRDQARLLSHLNVTQDARVEALRKNVEKHLCAAEPKDLRNNAVLRTKVAAMATSIIQEMNK